MVEPGKTLWTAFDNHGSRDFFFKPMLLRSEHRNGHWFLDFNSIQTESDFITLQFFTSEVLLPLERFTALRCGGRVSGMVRPLDIEQEGSSCKGDKVLRCITINGHFSKHWTEAIARVGGVRLCVKLCLNRWGMTQTIEHYCENWSIVIRFF